MGVDLNSQYCRELPSPPVMLGLKPELALQASPHDQSATSDGSQYAARANWVYGANAASAELLRAVTVSRFPRVCSGAAGEGAAKASALSERVIATERGNIVNED